MKRSKLIGLLLAAVVLPLALAACVYEEYTGGQPGYVPITTLPATILPFASATFTPGTHTVEVMAFHADDPIVVEVTFGVDQIQDITIVSHNESTYGSAWFQRAYPLVPDQILVRQSTLDIDTPIGATITRDAIIEAVNEAIVLAGATPEALEPVFIDAPVTGDRFIPGFHIITIPANAMDWYGNTLTEETRNQRMLYSEEDDMTVRVSVGRNEFHLNVGGAFGLAQGGGGHGESIAVGEVGGGAWGSWWFRQVAQHQVNDMQTTRWAENLGDGTGVDVHATGATMSAAAILWGVEQALISSGGTGDVDPRQVPPTQVLPNPSQPYGAFFVPGIYEVVTESGQTVRVTLDRTLIRRIVTANNPEGWVGGEFNTYIRDVVFQGQVANNLPVTVELLETAEGIPALPEVSRQVFDAILEILHLADAR